MPFCVRIFFATSVFLVFLGSRTVCTIFMFLYYFLSPRVTVVAA